MDGPVPARHRVVEVIADLGEGQTPRWRYGSGLLLGDRQVLTCAHVVDGSVSVVIRRPDKSLLKADIEPAFIGKTAANGLDLAILHVPEAAALAHVPVALVNRDVTGGIFLEGCSAVGYPAFQETSQQADGPSIRESAQVRGSIAPLSGLVSGLLSLEVTSSPRDLPAAGTTLANSAWAGMSGAAVFARHPQAPGGEVLLGVVVEHSLSRGQSDITVLPLDRLTNASTAPVNASEWWRRLGVPDPKRLPLLPCFVPASEIEQYRLDFADETAMADKIVGRTTVFAALEQFAGTHASGYFRLTADAGLGKTALAAAVSRRFGAVSFFANTSRGRTRADQCLNHLSAEIISRFDLPYDRLPARTGEDSGFLEKILQEAVEKARKPVWLVVDALDEGDISPGRNSLSLPKRLPANVYCFLTQRPGEYPLATTPETALAEFPLAWDSDAQRDDVLALLASEVTRPEIARALSSACPDRDVGSVVAELAELSEGNFMYLSYVLQDIASGAPMVGQSDRVTILPRGLRGYYAAMWARMEALTQTEGGRDWRTLYRPVIGLLAVAGEPVTVDWLADLSGCDREDIQNPVLYRWRRFLSRDGNRWRILHRSFGDFLKDTLDLSARHGVVARLLGEPANWEKHGGYASRHESTHLRAAGDLTGIIGLLYNPAWYESQVTADPTGVRYQSDLLQGFALAGETVAEATAHGASTPALVDWVKCALMLSTIADHWTAIPINTIDILLEAGILSDVQALGLIEKMDPDVRGPVLVAIVPRLSQALFARAEAVARGLPAELFVEVLVALAECASGQGREAILGRALASVDMIGDDSPSKPDLICRASIGLASDAREIWLARALDLSTKASDPVDCAFRLAPLVGTIPSAAELLRQALCKARETADEDPGTNRADEFEDLIRGVPSEYRPALAREAITVASLHHDASLRAAALTALVVELPEPERAPTITAAQAAAQSIRDPADQTDRYADLSSALHGDDRSALLDLAERSLLDVTDPVRKAKSLLRLAGLTDGLRGQMFIDRCLELIEKHVPPDERLSVLTSSAAHLEGAVRDIVLEHARTLATEQPTRFARVRGLIEVGQAWSGNRLRELVHEATSAPAGILAIGRPPDDGVERAELLVALLPDLRETARDIALNAAKALVDAIERPYSRALIRANLLPALEADEKLLAENKILLDIKLIEDFDERADVLTALMNHLPSCRAQKMSLALTEARSIAGEHFSGTIDHHTGRVTVFKSSEFNGRPSLAVLRIALMSGNTERAALVAEALDRVFDLHAGHQSEVLSRLAPHLSAAQARQVVAHLGRLLQDPLRKQLYESLVSNSPAQPNTGTDIESGGVAETAAGAEAQIEPKEPNEVRFSVGGFRPSDLFRLVRDPTQTQVEISFDTPPKWESESARDQAYRGISVFIARQVVKLESPADLASILAAGRILYEGGWNKCLACLLVRIADLESTHAALCIAGDIWGDGVPPIIVASLIGSMNPPERRKFVDSARATAGTLSNIERAKVIGLLLPHMEQVASRMAIQELEGLVEQMSADDVKKVLEQLDVQSLAPAALLPFVKQLLRPTKSRRELLSLLATMLLPMKRLAGATLAQSLLRATLEAVDFVR
jgi:serine/threonine-protein kinase